MAEGYQSAGGNAERGGYEAPVVDWHSSAVSLAVHHTCPVMWKHDVIQKTGST